jgi:hypothetical protein
MHFLTILVHCHLVYSKLDVGIRPYASNIWFKFYEFSEMIVISFDCTLSLGGALLIDLDVTCQSKNGSQSVRDHQIVMEFLF